MALIVMYRSKKTPKENKSITSVVVLFLRYAKSFEDPVSCVWTFSLHDIMCLLCDWLADLQ